MSSFRLAPVLVLVLAACAGWEAPAPNHGPPPPAESPTPSHYAPPPPVDTTPTPAGLEDRVAIGSVQLLDDCPDAPEQAVEAERAAEAKPAAYAPRCEQSTVQLAVRSDRGGRLGIEAVRVLGGARQRLAGSSTLRQPTRWGVAEGRYLQWDGVVAAGAAEQRISYKLGALDLAQAQALAGADFNPYSGPFMLEIDVSIDGRRQTIRSPVFQRQEMDMVET